MRKLRHREFKEVTQYHIHWLPVATVRNCLKLCRLKQENFIFSEV